MYTSSLCRWWNFCRRERDQRHEIVLSERKEYHSKMKISEIIARYLESNKRLVVPQLGAFIVKQPTSEVIFSELLRRDDGVLRSLLVSHGMGELEAAGAINRYVFDIRHALQHGGVFTMEGLGVLTAGEKDTVLFRYAPNANQSDLIAMAADKKRDKITNPVLSTSAKVQPEDYVRGLRYTTKNKLDDKSYSYTRRSRFANMDKFLLLAILAAIIAVSAIVYGYINEQRNQEFEMELEQRRIDLTQMPAEEEGATQTSDK